MSNKYEGNYFAVGLGLIDFLESIKGELGVKTIGTAASMREISLQTTPALHIINTANSPVANAHIDSRDTQQWTVVIAVSNQAAQKNARKLLEKNGELVSKVINHVQGYQLAEDYEPLTRTTTSGQIEYYTTAALIPFTFFTKFQP